jgi:antitoxin HigA-1
MPPRMASISVLRRAIGWRKRVDSALRLARFFNSTPEFWMSLQTVFDLKIAKASKTAESEHDIMPLTA